MAAVCCVAAPISAQPSLTTQASDSVAKWAVPLARAGTTSAAILLESLDAQVERDGSGRRTHRTVVHVLQQSAVNGSAERRFSWQPSRQDFVLDWVRVLRPDGTVISNAPSTDQTGDATASMQNPIYVDSRTRRISLSGVAANTIVDVQYTVIDKSPWREGDFLINWQFSPPGPMRVSQLRVSVPSDFSPRIDERNLTMRRRESTEAGRTVYEWRAVQPPIVRAEPFASDSNDVRMTVTVSAPHSWDSVTTWYHNLARDSYTLDAASAARADSVVRGATSRTDTLQRLHKWIAQDIRYVSVSLGLGGFQPRSPLDVLSTGYGDCKDKTTLFVAAARRWGIDARAVLLNLNGGRDSRPVAINRFNHAIAAIAGPNNSYTFTDLTAGHIPYGQLPGSYRGAFGVVIRPDGTADEVQFPQRPADSTGSSVRMIATLQEDGRMSMRVEDRPRGDNAWAMRVAFSQPLDSARRATGLRGIATSYLPESTADSLQVFDGLDFSQPERVQAVLINGRGARPAGPVWLLHLPPAYRQVATSASNSARELSAMSERKLPIDATRVIGARIVEVEYRVTLPDGWRAQLPPAVSTTSFFARYESTYRMEGRDLVMRRVLRGQGEGVHPPQRIVEVIAWMRAVAADDIEFITLTPSPR